MTIIIEVSGPMFPVKKDQRTSVTVEIDDRFAEIKHTFRGPPGKKETNFSFPVAALSQSFEKQQLILLPGECTRTMNNQKPSKSIGMRPANNSSFNWSEYQQMLDESRRSPSLSLAVVVTPLTNMLLRSMPPVSTACRAIGMTETNSLNLNENHFQARSAESRRLHREWLAAILDEAIRIVKELDDDFEDQDDNYSNIDSDFSHPQDDDSDAD